MGLWLVGLGGLARIVATQLVLRRVVDGGVGWAGWLVAALAVVAGLIALLPAVRSRFEIAVEPPPPAEAGHEAIGLLLAAAQTGLVVLLFRTFQIEHAALHQILGPLIFFGFLAHQGLAERLRLPAFVALSLCALALVLGGKGTAALVGIGLVLIGLCHVRIPFPGRTALLLAAGTAVAAARAGAFPSPVPSAVWPLVGSFFMFRTISYYYDLRHAKAPPGLWPTLAYFFLLPNVVFLLFPIVDFQAMRRGFHGRPAPSVRFKGLRWILRGIVYLLLYRYVYRYLAIPAIEVTSSGELWRFLLSNYLLLLQVLGQFDVAIGILHLFGFDLPETNDLNLFSAGFTDFWRRTNTYWRDFIMKLVYHPAYFALRGKGSHAAVLAATALAFVATALLHAYQWFWLRGTPRFTTTDVLFWTTFGVLLLANVEIESRRPRRTTLGKPRHPWLLPRRTVRETVVFVGRVAAMFAFISVFWALWSAASLGDWLSLVRRAGSAPGHDLRWIPELAAILLVYGVGFHLARGPAAGSSRRRVVLSASGTTLLMASLVLAATPVVYGRLGTDVAELVRSLKVVALNRADDQELVRSYYENLANVNVTNPALWRTFEPVALRDGREWIETLGRPTGDLRRVEMIANGRSEKDAIITTNRWGMRDRDYELAKARGTFRAAFLGGSYVTSPNVADDETFEHLLEERINRENDRRRYAHYDLLNLAVGGYGPLESLVHLEKKAIAFGPDVVLYVSVEGELRRAALALARGVGAGVDLEYPGLKDLVTLAGVDAGLSEAESMRRLRPRQEALLVWVYRRMVEVCRARDAVPVWVGLPPIELSSSRGEAPVAARLAAEAGFVVVRLDHVYDGVDPATISVARTNHHPNRKGTRLIADALHRALLEHAAEIPFDLPVPAR